MGMKRYNIVLIATFLMAENIVHAQDIHADYTAELHTNTKNIKFSNLLQLKSESEITKHLSWHISTISIANSNEELLANDLQSYSNIQEANLPIALSVCGLQYTTEQKHNLFIGIRNMNEDYFSTPVATFFTNSSCGLPPTIGANYPIANYPVASVGVHYSYETEICNLRSLNQNEATTETESNLLSNCVPSPLLLVQISIYNGHAYNGFWGKESVFHFSPSTDGLFIVGEMMYKNKNSTISIGNATHWYYQFYSTPWIYIEQQIHSRLALATTYSCVFGDRTKCQNFVGGGILCRLGKGELGLFTDYARYDNTTEKATEISWKMAIGTNLYIQTSTHYIVSAQRHYTIVSLRVGLKC